MISRVYIYICSSFSFSYISSAILPAGSPVKASVLESILEAMSRAREISSDTPLRGWLCAITAQKALKRAPLSQMGADMFSDPSEPLTNPDNLQSLSDLINQLSRSAQVLLMLYIYGECTVPQLSELTGWPEPLVTSILERSLRHLRRCITVTDGSNPIGQVIRFNQVPFRVIGVLKSKGYNSMGMDQDDIVLAPYTTVMKRLLAQTYLEGIFASALSEDMTDYATDEITTILRRNHKLLSSDEDDFTIRSQQELSSMLNSTTDLMTTLLACIAGISLVVGGIGIMNIMYVSVTERTREIGLRMSVGARGVDILSQFLIEAILISITGGLIGVILGCGASWIVKDVAHWPIYIQPWSVLLSFAVCTVTGIFFGWYPAQKAAGLDPIEALRYE